MNVDAVQPVPAARPRLDVVIVGAGIAGLTAALLLDLQTAISKHGRVTQCSG